MTDDLGRPNTSQTQPELDARTPSDTSTNEQTVIFNSAQAAQQLGVDARTVRRYINEGIHAADGSTLRMKANQVRTNRGPEWQMTQHDLDTFKRAKDNAATEGQEAAQVHAQSAAQEQQSQALTASLQLFAVELERRSQALTRAQDTIERLAMEAGRQIGRNEELERERDALRQHVAELEHEREQWQQKAPRKIRLLPWQKE